MRKLLLLSLSATVLSACHPVAIPEEVVMTAKTTLPASVGATENLTINLQVIQGCTFLKTVKVLERTASKLSIQVVGNKKFSCPALPNAAALDFTFTDTVAASAGVPENPIRTSSFEVWVNGGKVGTVAIK